MENTLSTSKKKEKSRYDYGVVPAPDGKIYLVDINGTHYWGSFYGTCIGVKSIFWKIEKYQYMQKKEVHVLMGS